MATTRAQVLILLGVIIFLWMVLSSKHKDEARPDTPGGHAFRQRLVAVGDLHGGELSKSAALIPDVANARKVLRMMDVIDSNYNWAGGSDILVQTGDIVDRGATAYDIYELMKKLRGQARDVGGRVVSILGNHEVMNAIGDWRYVTQADIKRFGGTEARIAAMQSDGWLGQEWLNNYNVTARVPLSPYPNAPALSFTHGSLRPSYPNLTPYPDAINALGHSLMVRALTPPMAKPYPPNPYEGLPKGTTPAEAELYDGGGPLWWRGLSYETKDEKLVCTWAKELQERLDVRRIIGVSVYTNPD